jgi:hypothetical protein
MKIRAVPVGCMLRGCYGSRIGLIRTEINLGSFDSLLLFNLFLADRLDYIFSSHFIFLTLFRHRSAIVFPERNGLQRQSSAGEETELPSVCPSAIL